MFVSKRILFFKSKENGYMLFCGNSNSFYLIEDENVPIIKNMIDTGREEGLPEDIRKEFVKSGVLLNESDEEFFNRLKFSSYLTRFSKNHLALTIAPTMACNFKCVYCFEGERVQNFTMTEEVIDGLINFIKNRDCKFLNLAWYGGEPLCAWNKIVEINNRLKELNIPKISQSIVTNGSLLDEKKIQYFIDNNIRQIQITLDGKEETHNQRRPMKNGENSYQSIITALDKLYKICKEKNEKLYVSIRINVDKSNMDVFHGLYTELNSKYENMFNIYPAFVNKDSESDCHADACLNSQEYSTFILDLITKYKIQTHSVYPLRNMLVGCAVNCINTYVISSNGDIYRCWEDINIQNKKIGNVIKGIDDVSNIVQSDVMEGSGFEDEKCKDCLFLYSCMGGCPKKRKENMLLKKELNPVCSSIKTNPESYLEAYYEYKNKKMVL